MPKYILAILALTSGLASASLLEELEGTNCTVTSYEDVVSATQECETLVLKDITVPANQLLKIDLLPGAILSFVGTIKWEYAEWSGPLIEISGDHVEVRGEDAVLDGQGLQWWDNQGENGKQKPKLLRIRTTGGSVFTNINILNCPVHCVSINNARDTILDNFIIDITDGDSAGAKNTDGFDISGSTGITIQNSIVQNQDDCVAVNQGSNMLFYNLTCSGGHGLSLSVGQSSSNGSINTVKNITFTDCIVQNSDNGIHVKTHTNAGTGSISDVTYSNIQLFGIRKYGINAEEDYMGGRPTKKPVGNIPIVRLTMNNVSGSMSGDSNSRAVYILCGSGGCSDWTWSGVSIANSKKADSCNFIPNGYTC